MVYSRQFVVRYQRQDRTDLSLPQPDSVESVVVEAENVPMAVREFYREFSDARASLSLVEIYERQYLENRKALARKYDTKK